jgi:glycosyltransferase involved in cell wall biosynthesis
MEAIVHSARCTAYSLRHNFDVVHYHAVGPGLAAPLARLRHRSAVVLTVHGLDAERNKWGSKARAVLRTATYMSSWVPETTVVVSESLADHYRERYGSEVVHIPNGVQPLPPSPSTDVLRRLDLRDGKYLLFVGRLVPEKAPDRLIEAFRDVPTGMKLVIAGGSSHTDDYCAHIRELAGGDPRIVLPGYVYGDDLATLYRYCAAYVLPSVLEGLPLTLLEAASYGAPILASDIPPNLEILSAARTPAGVRTFSAGDIDSLRAELRLVCSPRWDLAVARMGAARLRDAVLRRYSWDEATDALESTYLDALNSRRQRPALLHHTRPSGAALTVEGINRTVSVI